MAPIAERLVPAEAAAAELDLPGDLGEGRLDDVAGIVEDHDRALDDDRTRGLEGDGDGGGGVVGGHWRNIRRKDGKTERRKDGRSTDPCQQLSVFPTFRLSVLRRPEPQRLVLEGLELRGSRPERGGDALRGQQRPRPPVAQVVPARLGENPAEREPRARAHPAGEVLEPEAQAGPIEVVMRSAAEEGLDLAEALVVPAGVAEVIGGVEPRDDRL